MRERKIACPRITQSKTIPAMMRRAGRIAIVASFLAATPGALLSQNKLIPALSLEPLVRVSSDSMDRYRLRSLAGDSVMFPLLRSVSSLEGSPKGDWSPVIALIAPEVEMVKNSALPFSAHSGSLWAGKGRNTRISGGLKLELGPLRAIVAPEFLDSENSFWILRDTIRFYAPPIPKERQGQGFVFPWYMPPYSIDLPLRMGPKRLRRTDPGQSSVLLYAGPLAFGAATENEWWGPGIRNAIILSDNAGGFPHLVLKTSRPRATRYGTFDFRLLVGGLTETNYFDTTSTDNLRSISLIGVAYQPPHNQNLTMGFARSVFGTVDNWNTIPGRALRVFTNTGRPSNREINDSTDTPGGEDQLLSLFARWVFPADGFEVYSELARMELPSSFRDLLIAPNHTQGYTLGLQWRKPAPLNGNSVRAQVEVTTLEQSATFRDRPVGSFYTSRRVIQGYTQRGKVLGASIGPGASGQWLAIDYLAPSWYAGPYVGRVRWNEDMHSTYGWPVYIGYCNHDISAFYGARAAWRTRLFAANADVTYANRYDAFFQEQSGCPNGPSRLDIRNRTISLSVSSAGFWR